MQSFNELKLSTPIMTAIQEMGFEKPSPIQAQALPILLDEPTDFLGLAATGTGKTAAFGIPLLERIDPSLRAVQALILCPTRELAMQVAGQISLLGKHLNVKALPIYGGSSYNDQILGLKRGATVVVGTPGRVIDHMERGTLKLDSLEVLILDEADEMISMGFKDELETILESVPQGKSNIWLFSATMSPEIRRVADKYLNDPKQVQVNRTEMLPTTVEQLYYMTSESNKPEVLCKLIDAADEFYGLIFCQTKALVVDLLNYLRGRGYPADCLHGDMEQNARERTMKAFRERKTTVLICTDVASRGLDVKDVSHVVNYSLPRELDNYVHRIGRTGRSGKSGIAMSLVTGSHRPLIGRIERMTKSRMKEGKIPTRKEIGAKKIAKMLADFEAQATYARAVELMGPEWKDVIAAMPAEEIAGRFLALLNPEVFSAEPAKEREYAAPTAGAGAGVVVKAGRVPTGGAHGRGPGSRSAVDHSNAEDSNDRYERFDREPRRNEYRREHGGHLGAAPKTFRVTGAPTGKVVVGPSAEPSPIPSKAVLPKKAVVAEPVHTPLPERMPWRAKKDASLKQKSAAEKAPVGEDRAVGSDHPAKRTGKKGGFGWDRPLSRATK